MNDAALLASPLFRGATSEEIAAMLPCLMLAREVCGVWFTLLF